MTQSENASRKKLDISVSYSLWAGVILLLGFLIRLINISRRSFYVDESVTIYISSRPMGAILPFMMELGEVHPPVYFWGIRLWLDLWPHLRGILNSFEAFTRLSSVIFSLGGIYLSYLLGLRLYDRLTGLLCGLMLSFSTYHIIYSQELRMYPLLLFLFLASFNLFLVFIEKPSFLAGAGLFIVNSAALLTHYYGVYIFLVELIFGVYIILWLARQKKLKNNTENNSESPCDGATEIYPVKGKPDCFMEKFLTHQDMARKNLRATVAVSISSALVLIWWVPYFLKQTGHQDFTLRLNPGFLTIFELFSQLGYGSTLPGAVRGGPGFYHIAALLPIFLLIRGFLQDRIHGRVFAGAYLLVPLLVTVGVTFTRFHIFEFKYFYVLAPAFWLLVVRGAMGLRLGKFSGGILLVAILIVNLFSASNFFFDPYYQTQDWRGAARLVARQAKPGDRVIVNPSMMSLPFYHYYPGKDQVMPMDHPDPARLDPLFQQGAGIWVVSTVNHPFVRQAGLVPYLASRMKGREVAKIDNHNPADVLVVYYFITPQKEKGDNGRNINIPLK